jgi:hypothetical protein
MNQDADELFNAAIEDAKYNDKIEALRKKGIQTFGLTDEQNELLTNLMTMNEDGSYSIRLSNGAIKRLEEIPSNDLIYKTIEQDRKNEKSAILRKTLAERIGIAIDRFNIGFSQVFVVLEKHLTNSGFINNLDTTAGDIANNTINFLNKQLSGSGGWSDFIKKGLKAANEFIDKILGIWMNPDTIFTEKFAETLRTIFVGIKDICLPYLEYYSGRLLEIMGKALPAFGSKFEKAGLELQKKGMKRAGKDSMLYNNNEDLSKRINEWNAKNGGMDMEGLNTRTGVKVVEASAHIMVKNMEKNVFKTVAKRIPGLGLAIGIFDAIGQAIEGDYGQAAIALASGAASTVPGVGTVVSIGLDATNAYIDHASGENHINVNDALIRSDGTYNSGNKGSAVNYLKAISDVNYQESNNTVNLILTGRIKHNNKNNNLSKNNMSKALVMGNKLIIEQLALS